MTRGFALVALGVTLFIAGFVASWAQDVAAPWINEGEAQMRGTVGFDADGGTYRVVSSGATRPEYGATVCTITAADGTSRRELGGSGSVNPNDRLGVSRVLEFETAPGATRVSCGDRYIQASTRGRFQIVPADGIVSKAIVGAFVLGGLSLLAGILLIVLAYRRAH